VHITRLVMNGSVEEKMLKLADAKRQIYKGTLGKMSAKQLQEMK
jgi:SNF2 family DNA or RNA helicase